MLYALRRKEAVKLSKQELIDCMPTNQGNGCNYGLPPDAYKYIKQMGVHTEMDYPYRGVVSSLGEPSTYPTLPFAFCPLTREISNATGAT